MRLPARAAEAAPAAPAPAAPAADGAAAVFFCEATTHFGQTLACSSAPSASTSPHIPWSRPPHPPRHAWPSGADGVCACIKHSSPAAQGMVCLCCYSAVIGWTDGVCVAKVRSVVRCVCTMRGGTTFGFHRKKKIRFRAAQHESVCVQHVRTRHVLFVFRSYRSVDS